MNTLGLSLLTPARLAAAIDQATAQGVDFVVIDTPPHSGTDAAAAARCADLVLVPLEPHLFTLETLPKLAVGWSRSYVRREELLIGC